jgi:hypothetical protein
VDDKIAIEFLHPKTSESFSAALSPQCPAEVALRRLQMAETGPFLEAAPAGRPYQLVVERTAQELTPNTTMADAGLKSGDRLLVMQKMQGANG